MKTDLYHIQTFEGRNSVLISQVPLPQINLLQPSPTLQEGELNCK